MNCYSFFCGHFFLRYMKVGTFNLYVLFLYMLCVFIYSRIFLDIYGLFIGHGQII